MAPPDSSDFLDRLAAIIVARRGGDTESSYVAALTARGRPHLARKFGEEAVETIVAALAPDTGETRAALIAEAADTVFHLLVLLADAGVTPADIRAELARRDGVSGHDEKASRQEP